MKQEKGKMFESKASSNIVVNDNQMTTLDQQYFSILGKGELIRSKDDGNQAENTLIANFERTKERERRLMIGAELHVVSDNGEDEKSETSFSNDSSEDEGVEDQHAAVELVTNDERLRIGVPDYTIHYRQYFED